MKLWVKFYQTESFESICFDIVWSLFLSHVVYVPSFNPLMLFILLHFSVPIHFSSLKFCGLLSWRPFNLAEVYWVYSQINKKIFLNKPVVWNLDFHDINSLI